MLIDVVKDRVKQAMVSKNDKERDIFRVVLGELQRSGSDKVTDEQVVKTIKKMVDGNNETLKVCPVADPRFASLNAENQILTGLLPQEWDAQTIEAFFLNHDDPLFEQIRDAAKEGMAIGIASKSLKAVNAPVDNKVVAEVVKKIRSA